jgi:hypothetical protein
MSSHVQGVAVARQAELSASIDADADAEEIDEIGHGLVVPNGHHNEREVITATGRQEWLSASRVTPIL